MPDITSIANCLPLIVIGFMALMVLESIINPLSAEKTPWNMFFIGAIYSTMALFLGNWIFNEYASLIMVFLTTMACIPLLYKTMKVEEEKDTRIEKESVLLKEHSKAISFMMFLFLGVTAGLVLWYVVLPTGFVQNSFKSQTLTIQSINVKITGDVLKKCAKKDILVMHPGPINRGIELSQEVADGPYSVILEQVTNGVAIRMAVLFLLSQYKR